MLSGEKEKGERYNEKQVSEYSTKRKEDIAIEHIKRVVFQIQNL